MNFLRCVCRGSAFRQWKELSFQHVQFRLVCPFGFFNIPAYSKYTRCFYADGCFRAFSRLNTCGLLPLPCISTQKRRDCSQMLTSNSSESLSLIDRSSVSNGCEPTESLQKEERDYFNEPKRDIIFKKFGPNEYEFDAVNGYLSVDHLVKFLQHEAAFDICVIKTSGPRQAYVEYFVIVSGVSRRHIHAMAKNLEQLFKGQVVRGVGRAGHVTVEGLGTDSWLALDIGNMVVHFFLPETRSIYELEKLWTLGQEYDDQYKELLEEENFIKAVFVGEQTEDQDKGL